MMMTHAVVDAVYHFLPGYFMNTNMLIGCLKRTIPAMIPYSVISHSRSHGGGMWTS